MTAPVRSVSLPEIDQALADRLAAGCDTLGVDLSAEQHQQLLDYLGLLHKWNNTYNLTAVRDPQDMVARHLLDSLSIAAYLPAGHCLDVGTGPGLPGIPLAIARPEQAFDLLDSNGKKTRFLFQVKTALALDNIVIHQARVESFEPERRFQAITSRAFATLDDMFRQARHLLAGDGCCLAMKGVLPAQEVAAMEAQGVHCKVHRLAVPGLDEERHLVILRYSDDREQNQ